MSENLPIVTRPQVPTIAEYAANLNQQLAFATMLLKTQMLPPHFKTPEAVVTAILYGQEIGFSPMQALQSINVIQGKPTLSADGMKAKILERGGKVETIEWNDQRCTLKMWRGDWSEEFTFDLAMAQQQGLTGKDNWKRMPKQMLYARCVSTLGRNMYSDTFKGFYSTEEMRDAAPELKTADNQPVQVLPAPKAAISMQLETTTAIAEGRAYQYDTKRAGERIEPDQKKIMLGRLEKQYGLVFKDGFGWTSKPIPEWSEYLMNDISEPPEEALKPEKPAKKGRRALEKPVQDDLPYEQWEQEVEA